MNTTTPNEFPSSYVRPQAAVVQPSAHQVNNEDAEWAELEKELLSNSELQEVYDYLRTTGQLSA